MSNPRNHALLVQIVLDEVRRQPEILQLPSAAVLDVVRSHAYDVELQPEALAFCMRRDLSALVRKYADLDDPGADLCTCGHLSVQHGKNGHCTATLRATVGRRCPCTTFEAAQ